MSTCYTYQVYLDLSNREDLLHSVKVSLYNNKPAFKDVGDVFQKFLGCERMDLERLDAEIAYIADNTIDGCEIVQDNVLCLVLVTKHASTKYYLETLVNVLDTLGDIVVLVDNDNEYYYVNLGLGLYEDFEFYLEVNSKDDSISEVKFLKNEQEVLNYLLAIFPEFIDEILREDGLGFDAPHHLLSFLRNHYTEFTNSNCEFLNISYRGDDFYE